MKLRPLAAVVLATVTLCPHLAEARSKSVVVETVPIWAYAPADEYFGPLKMSILGVNNAIVNVKRRQHDGVMSDDTSAALAQVRLSIRDCQQKYPRDPWVARATFALATTYAAFSDARARRRAGDTAAWLASSYPRSTETLRLRYELARGHDRGSGAAVTLNSR